MKLRSVFAFLFLGLATSACAAPGDGSPSPEPGSRGTTSEADGGDAAACTGVVELGRCEVAGGGTDCSTIAEDHVFVPLGEGEPMTMVLGPQGSMMFVFAARTSGIDPADPLVEINVHDAANDIVGRYRARVDFEPEPNEPALLGVAGLFVVVDTPPQQLEGQSLAAKAVVEDQKGVVHCGSVKFVAAY